MGLSQELYGKRVYLDANIFIYVIEQVTPHNDVLRDLFEHIDAENIFAYTSALTLAEVLVKPFIDNNQELINIYKNLLLAANVIKLVEISPSILIQAAQYRSLFNVKLPDAIHIATSMQLKTDCFLTNDQAIKTNSAMTVLQLADLSK